MRYHERYTLLSIRSSPLLPERQLPKSQPSRTSIPVHVSTKGCFVKDGTALGRANVAAAKTLIKTREIMTAFDKWEFYVKEREKQVIYAHESHENNIQPVYSLPVFQYFT